ncbi:MAG: cupin domain-containing protein [Gammaproteobacteria bacterium]|nr:cupin domain-containing protein [Gammaproteobacteria bacterium]
MFISNKDQADVFDEGHGELIYPILDAAHGNAKNYSVAHIELLAGKQSKKHYHPKFEESYYILLGQARMVVDEIEKIVKPGDIVVIEPKQWHQIFNESTESLHFLAICSPAWTPDCSVFAEENND